MGSVKKPCARCAFSYRYPTGGCKVCAIVRRLDNGDAHRAYYKCWRADHPEECRAYSREHYRRAPEKQKRLKKDWELRHYPGKLLQSARDTSRTYGWVCDLDVSDIAIPGRCPLLGLLLDCRAPARSDNLPSIDRIDPSKGYIKGNVWVVSWRANRLKSDASLEELEGIVRGMQLERARKASIQESHKLAEHFRQHLMSKDNILLTGVWKNGRLVA